MPGLKAILERYITPATLPARLSAWMREIAPYQFRRVRPLAPENAALLVVDMTRAFIQKGLPLSSPNAPVILPRVRAMVRAFHEKKRPVLWAVQGHRSVAHDRGPLLSQWWPVPILENTAGVRLARGLKAGPHDKIIYKRRYSGFYQTDLELTLRSLGIKSLVICGILTNVCPYTTAFDAFSRGFRVYYAADGTAALNEQLHVGALCNIAGWAGHVVPVDDIVHWISRKGGRRRP